MTKARDVSTPTALVLLNTTTFSAQSSVSINNVFTSSYENYQIVYTLTTDYGANLNLRIRASGTDYTTATQCATVIERASTGFTTGASTVDSGAYLGFARQSKSAGIINIYSPQLAATETALTSNTLNFTSGYHSNWLNMCAFNTTSSYDGFTMFLNIGTMTGTIKIYGYK